MTIYTSSWFTTLPPEIQKIGVSRGTPRGYPAGYRKLMALAPGSWFNSVSVAEYKRRYFGEILADLKPARVIAEIERLAGGRDCALLCYESPEKPDDWCHRGFVSAWLFDTIQMEVYEFGHESEGCGWRHPKIPHQYRLGPRPAPLDVGPWIGSEAPGRDGHVWKVVGFDPQNPDQALIECGAERRSISADVLQDRFPRIL